MIVQGVLYCLVYETASSSQIDKLTSTISLSFIIYIYIYIILLNIKT